MARQVATNSGYIPSSSASQQLSLMERDQQGDTHANNMIADKALQTPGGLFIGYAGKTATYTTTALDAVIGFDATSGAVTVNLLAAVSAYLQGQGNQVLWIKRVDSSVNVLTLDGASAETIDGDATINLNLKDEAAQIQIDGTNWRILNRYIPTVITTKSADFTCDGAANIYAVTVGAGGVTATLPPAASWKNKRLIFKRMDSGAGNFVLDGNAAELVDGASTITLSATIQNATEIISNGTGWLTISNRN